MKIVTNKEKINKVIEKVNNAVIETGTLFGRTMTEEISANKWKWTDGELRDIVDTGDLRKSLLISNPRKWSVRFDYTVDYALINHEGGVSQDGIYFVPRPWSRTARQRFNFESTMATVLKLKM